MSLWHVGLRRLQEVEKRRRCKFFKRKRLVFKLSIIIIFAISNQSQSQQHRSIEADCEYVSRCCCFSCESVGERSVQPAFGSTGSSSTTSVSNPGSSSPFPSRDFDQCKLESSPGCPRSSSLRVSPRSATSIALDICHCFP